ncbi:MAG: patatin-like phospholipase family protein [Egibacteraceae bacterium]
MREDEERWRSRRAQLREHLALLFGGLDDDVADRIVDSVEWVTIPAGQAVFEQDDDPDGAYVVLSGRLRILRTDGGGTVTAIGEVGRGELLGEMALLDGGARLGRPLAVRDTDLARLPRPVFDDLMEQHLPAMMGVTRTILRRVRDRAGADARGPHSTVVALIVAAPDAPLEELGAELRDSLGRSGTVCHASPADVASLLGRDESRLKDHADTLGPHLAQWLDDQEDAHEVVLLQTDPSWTEWTRWAAGQADHLILVARAGDDPRPGEIERRLAESIAARQPRQTLLLLHEAGTARPRRTRAWLDTRTVDLHLHVRTGLSPDIDRVARHVTGRAVGLALGGGGARGFAHIGVLRALHELGIPVDVCAGASIGAVFAAAYGLGRPVEDLAGFARPLFTGLLDYTPPLASLLRARRLTQSIDAALGDRDLADMWTPTVVTTTSLTRARAVTHDRGPAVRLVRTSVSIPGVMPPVVIGDELHVDGGVLDNLPVRAVRSQAGVGTVIAVDVAPHAGPSVTEDHGLHLSGWALLRDRLLPGRTPSQVPGIMSTLLRSMLAAAERERTDIIDEGLADLFLQLDVPDLGLLDFESIVPTAKAGYAQASPQLERWLASLHPPDGSPSAGAPQWTPQPAHAAPRGANSAQ